MNKSKLDQLSTLITTAQGTACFLESFYPTAFVQDPYTRDWNIRLSKPEDGAKFDAAIKSVDFLRYLLDHEEARVKIKQMKPVCFLMGLGGARGCIEVGIQMKKQRHIYATFYSTENGYGITTI